MFLFKNKTVVLDCFAHESSPFDLATPKSSIKFIPEWWKTCPTHYHHNHEFFKTATAKKCSGLIELYKHGFMLPLWSDLCVQIQPIGNFGYAWQFSDGASKANSHSFEQVNNHLDPKKIVHLKLISPWLFKCKEEIKWLVSSPTWNTLGVSEYKLVPGILDFKYQHVANANLLFFRSDKQTVVDMHFGTPLMHFVPITKRKFKLNYNLVSNEEWLKIKNRSAHVSFINKYLNIKNALKEKNT